MQAKQLIRNLGSAALILLWVASAGTALGADYRLGAGDLLRINVAGYPDMTQDTRISQLGSITYPFVGELKVAGLSAHDVESLLATKLNDGGFIRQPQVSVLVSEYKSQTVSVMGQVNKPGQYPLDVSHNVIDLLAQAGGLVTPTAADEATLLRNNGTAVPVDLYALFNGEFSQNLAVSAGDTIFVPRAAQFYIYGEVQKPGVYRLERGMTVSQAISAGGGLTPRGSERRAIVKRREAGGKEREISVAGADRLRPDDVLLIKERLF